MSKAASEKHVRAASERDFTEYFAWDAEGWRIGLMCCRECGASILLGDSAFDAAQVHLDWHASTRPTARKEQE